MCGFLTLVPQASKKRVAKKPLRDPLDKGVPYVAQECFRAGHRSSGLDFGRILIWKASNSALRPAGGPILRLSRTEAQLGSPISGPEAPLRNVEYLNVPAMLLSFLI
jgi:hypothetical protein